MAWFCWYEVDEVLKALVFCFDAGVLLLVFVLLLLLLLLLLVVVVVVGVVVVVLFVCLLLLFWEVASRMSYEKCHREILSPPLCQIDR